MKLTVRELVLFPILGVTMFVSMLLMSVLPNVHLIACFTAAYTVVYRKKALYPVLIYVLLCLLYFGPYDWPYLYLWPMLWGAVMLLPRHMKPWIAAPVYMTVCGLHGLAFGTLYAPAQALMYGLSWKATLAWIAAGFPYDVIHGISDFAFGSLVLPLALLLTKLEALSGTRGTKKQKEVQG